MPFCGDFGGVNKRGEPCERRVDSGRCHFHPPTEEDPIPMEVLDGASEEDPYPTGGLTAQAQRVFDRYSKVVPPSEHGELYVAILAFDGMVRAGAAMARDGATVEDRAHGKEAKANAASLVYKRMASAWSDWVERLDLENRLDQTAEDDPLGDWSNGTW